MQGQSLRFDRRHLLGASGHPLGTALRACRRMPTTICTFANLNLALVQIFAFRALATLELKFVPLMFLVQKPRKTTPQRLAYLLLDLVR